MITRTSSRNEVIRSVGRNGMLLKFASASFQDDEKLVIKAVSQSGLAIQYASTRLCGIKSVMLRAVVQCGMALEYASQNLKSDRQVVLCAVARDGNALKVANIKFRDDKEVVICAILQVRALYKFAIGNSFYEAISKKLLDDNDVARSAVSRYGESLKYMSSRIRNDKEIVAYSVFNYSNSLEFASRKLQLDRELIFLSTNRENLNRYCRLTNKPPDKNMIKFATVFIKEDNPHDYWWSELSLAYYSYKDNVVCVRLM